ncbi:MAG: Holliday junction resolvase RuvX [Solirubrobacteraceae bacterium]
MRVIALDYGSARCGCAVSDPTGTLATPIEPVLAAGSRRGRARLRGLVEHYDAQLVLVGLPLSLSGGDSAQTVEAREFAASLERSLPVPVRMCDERFTTQLAQRIGGRTSEDSRAAAHLLEGWLVGEAARAARERGDDGDG